MIHIEADRLKIAVLTYRVLHSSMPRYLGLLTSVVDLPSHRALRWAVTNCLVVPDDHDNSNSYTTLNVRMYYVQSTNILIMQ